MKRSWRLLGLPEQMKTGEMSSVGPCWEIRFRVSALLRKPKASVPNMLSQPPRLIHPNHQEYFIRRHRGRYESSRDSVWLHESRSRCSKRDEPVARIKSHERIVLPSRAPTRLPREEGWLPVSNGAIGRGFSEAKATATNSTTGVDAQTFCDCDIAPCIGKNGPVVGSSYLNRQRTVRCRGNIVSFPECGFAFKSNSTVRAVDPHASRIGRCSH